MRLISFVCALVLLAISTSAQIVPRAEVFGGYSYGNVDLNGLGPRQSFNGWEASTSFNVSPSAALEIDGAGYYKKYGAASVRDYLLLGGGRFNFRYVYVHGLIGGDVISGGAYGYSSSDDGFATALGGGFEVPVSPRLAVRSGADYVYTKFDGISQSNFRVGVGLVFRLGQIAAYSEPSRSRADRSIPRALADQSEEAILFGIAGVPASSGVRATLVRYQSAANRAGIQIDDVVTRIDGAPMHTIKDIETAVGKNITGSIHVEYLTKGIGAVESTVAVAPPPQ